MAPQVFDRSLLPEADFEFVLLSDTHYMLEDAEAVEFDSRRRQTSRTAHALELAAALDPAFVVHLGDLVQEFPGSDGFDDAIAEAERQFRGFPADVHHVAGNHDVGDKPDSTMPTQPVTEASLQAYHDRFGSSWYSWDHGGVHFVVLNSQIMNAALPAAADQRAWLEADLRAADSPVLVFLHLPPFLHRPDEPAIGHYDNIGFPAREWLLRLLEGHSVTHLFAGHSHFSFRNRAGDVRMFVAPSPSFTRPGFGELFSSCPPPERGRDDRGKLGFYLVRMVDREPHFHFVRTGGRTEHEVRDGDRRLLTRSTAAVRRSPIGVSLLHPLSNVVRIPATFPSAVRQTVHNDYPTLGCLEAGANFVRTSITEMEDGASRRRLADLQAEGITIVGTVVAEDNGAPPPETGLIDEIEVRIPGGPLPSAAALEQVEELRPAFDRVSLSTVIPQRSVEGKQHDRQRGAYLASELDVLDAHLADHGVEVDRVLCWVGSDVDPWQSMDDERPPDAFSQIGAVDWLLSTVDNDEGQAIDRLSRSVFAAASGPESRLILEPYRALDRTMDLAPGLLDRRCNPTDAFSVVRCLNTLLFGDDIAWQRGREFDRGGVDYLGLEGQGTEVVLALPLHDHGEISVDGVGPGSLVPRWAGLLAEGTTRSIGPGSRVRIEGPTVLVFEE